MAKIHNKQKELKEGQEIKFEIKNNAWKHPLAMKGRIKALDNRFNGMAVIEKGAISEDEFIIRVESIT